jgi:anti-sigma factor RsiW
MDYAIDEIERDRRGELERHLEACEACRAAVERIRMADREIARLARQLRESVPVPVDEIEQALARMRTRSATAAPQQLVWLELFLTRMCGKHTAQRAISRAARETSAGPLESLGELQWEVFVLQLKSIVGQLCGEPAAQLLHAIGCGTR